MVVLMNEGVLILLMQKGVLRVTLFHTTHPSAWHRRKRRRKRDGAAGGHLGEDQINVRRSEGLVQQLALLHHSGA